MTERVQETRLFACKLGIPLLYGDNRHSVDTFPMEGDTA
jgi:hypothetical protein